MNISLVLFAQKQSFQFVQYQMQTLPTQSILFENPLWCKPRFSFNFLDGIASSAIELYFTPYNESISKITSPNEEYVERSAIAVCTHCNLQIQLFKWDRSIVIVQRMAVIYPDWN